MATNVRKAHATPSLTLGARRTVRRSATSLITAGQRSKDRVVDVTTRRVPSAFAAYFGAKGLRLVLNTATAALVLMLPFTAAATSAFRSFAADAAAPAFAATAPTETSHARRPRRVVSSPARAAR